MQRDKLAENLARDDKVLFANKQLEVKEVKRFREGNVTKVRVSFKGFRDVEFNLEQRITVVDNEA
jgi:hypothetical protein